MAGLIDTASGELLVDKRNAKHVIDASVVPTVESYWYRGMQDMAFLFNLHLLLVFH